MRLQAVKMFFMSITCLHNIKEILYSKITDVNSKTLFQLILPLFNFTQYFHFLQQFGRVTNHFVPKHKITQFVNFSHFFFYKEISCENLYGFLFKDISHSII